MTSRSWASSQGSQAYEPTFLEALVPALPLIAKHGIKIAVNAGASDTESLARVVKELVNEAKVVLNVAWIGGDQVLSQVLAAAGAGEDPFVNICTGETLKDWAQEYEPINAQAYLGGLGIAAALAKGADIVICGRVSDASPVIGSAFWWHGWERGELDKLANAFVAGHLIECSTYVTGGNFTGFKLLEGKWDDLGFPIAEISSSGRVIITKQKNSGGLVSVDTCTSQLLYEIQGPWYFNSDVTAILDGLWFEQLDTNRVALHGVKGDLPPPTTKIGLTSKPLYQAEAHWYLVGLDIEAKARMVESQVRRQLSRFSNAFTRLEFSLIGSAAENPKNQNSATVDLRIFVQAKKQEDLIPQKFIRPCLDVMMQSYPGATVHLDFRQGMPGKQVFEYYVTLMSQDAINHVAHLHDGTEVPISPPSRTKTWSRQQPSEPETKAPVKMVSFGSTVRGPLGWLVHARSGDKGSDANLGLWVRTAEEWMWLRSLLSVAKIKELLQGEYREGKAIVRKLQTLCLTGD